MVWLQFIVCLLGILAAGTRLARYADVIAEKSGLGRIWIGLALVGAITAMPEMATGVSAVALVDSPDLAIGTLIGSCCFNLSILAVLDWVNRRRPVLSQISRRHLPGVRWGVALLAIAGLGLYLAPRVSLPALAWLSLPGALLLLVYPFALRRILRAERRFLAEEMKVAARYATFSLRGALIRFFLAASVVVAAGIWLSFIGDEIAAVTGWGNSFVGTLFLAIATSVPELVVCVSAIRLGSPDIAMGDILGANMIDTGMVGLVDLFYVRGSVFAAASQINLVAILVAALMVAVTGFAILRPSERLALRGVSWYGPILVGLYVAAAYVLFAFGPA